MSDPAPTDAGGRAARVGRRESGGGKKRASFYIKRRDPAENRCFFAARVV